MMETLTEMLSYPFLFRALAAGVLISLCASLLGVSLVLKRCSMIGDGLSHVGFGALAVATAMNAAPLKVAVPVVIAAAFLLLRISGSSRIKGDAAIAMISVGSLAVGVMAISMTKGVNIDIYNYLFGSILAVTGTDLLLSLILAVVVGTFFLLFYPKLFAVTFDESFARATGINAGTYNMLIALLTAITIVLGMRLMGALLISSLIVFPSLTAMRVFRTFRSVVISSAILAAVCFCIGLCISCLFATPAGASVVCVNIAAFLLFSLIRLISRRA